MEEDLINMDLEINGRNKTGGKIKMKKKVVGQVTLHTQKNGYYVNHVKDRYSDNNVKIINYCI